MTIEENLINYGVLGLWTISLLYERYKTQKDLRRVIDRNTETLIKVHDVIEKCQRKR